MDEATRRKILGRLKRAKGQLAGIERMVEEDRYCVDVLVQIAAVRAALSKVASLMLDVHLATCVAEAVRSGDELGFRSTSAELLDVFHRYCGA